MKVYVYEKEADGQTFYYCQIGAEVHYRPTYTIWVSKSLLKADENGRLYLEFPFKGCEIAVGKRETTLILKPGNKTLYNFLVECGYRGSATIEEVLADEETITYEYEHYESERGSLGVSRGVLVITPAKKIKIKWHRNGRLYGKPSDGITILHSDGRVESVEGIEEEDLAELQEELKEV